MKVGPHIYPLEHQRQDGICAIPLRLYNLNVIVYLIDFASCDVAIRNRLDTLEQNNGTFE